MKITKKENKLKKDNNNQLDMVGATNVVDDESSINKDYVGEKLVFTGVDGIEYSENEWNAPVIKNGPTRCEVEEWKERYGGIYFTPFEGETFIWRTLKRPEYREIIRDQALTALDREEMLTEKCVLFPRNFTIEKMLKSKAGIPSILSEMIMDKSGFVAQSEPIKL
ncbi:MULTISPECIES: hypothetical protein [Bacillus]|jgi:hypothetical protein|uniref:hypothetical protein n=1 Tax=Bacillus TaxID=1386 RepID=UPI000738840E|nr:MULTISPECIES: hypothetical protein [Bacillus]MBS9805824.1 hypothetical protein [Bacillus toyonensis]MCU5508162.1 hypothetical protein [Bacillus cereus]KUF34470.1 hypothetical protein AMR94_02425 [Bacillus sp. G3(2015)]MDA1951666.1 hypothetical protein [Bacillus cereus]MDA2417001.1 hypothetical protein [Bacillus cereus]